MPNIAIINSIFVILFIAIFDTFIYFYLLSITFFLITNTPTPNITNETIPTIVGNK